MKILVTAGGTGGHVYPAYALIEWIQENHPEDRIYFIGTRDKLEAKLIPTLSIPYLGLPMRGMPRKISFQGLAFLFLTAFSFLIALVHLVRINPKAVIGFGGYVTFPVLLAAKLLGKNVVIHEQNTIPGLANRFFAPLANHIALNIPLVKPINPHKIVLTGTPLRKAIFQVSRDEGLKKLNLDPSRRVLLVMGGSQGALFINKFFTELLTEIDNNVPDWQIIHLTGSKQHDYVSSVTEKMTLKHYHSMQYIEDMASVLAVSDLAVCRAGATSLSELSSRGIPAILIPYPAASDNHQFHNALYYQEAGAAIMIEERELDRESFKKILFRLMKNPASLERMKEASHQLFLSSAAEKIYDLVIK